MLKKALSAVTLSAVAATVMLAASAQAANNNPLHPSFYQAKTTVETKASGAARYVDSRNPLSAAFTRAGEANKGHEVHQPGFGVENLISRESAAG